MRKNPPLKTAILAAALVVFFALPSLASAGQVVPPGNSAATQYTQVFPTSGGNVSVGTSIGETGGGGKKKPSQVIGEKTTQELESHGSEGKAVAQLAAESAPEPTSEPEPSESSGGGAAEESSGGGGNSGGNSGGGKHHAASTAAGKGNGAKVGDNGNGVKGGAQNGGAATGNAGGGAQATPQTGNSAAAEAAGSGSSGFSEVLGQATGASSGQMGVFLPLVLIGALVLALVYAWRRRQHEQEATP